MPISADSPQKTINRLHHLDAMRASLMILGVILHSALIFSPSESWIIYSKESSLSLYYLTVVIHSFRMPAFFVVSGFFAYVLIEQLGVKRFLVTRLTRIAVPFLFTALTLNSIQEYIVVLFEYRTFSLSNYFSDGIYVSHLWFLINLAFYFTLLAIGHYFFGAQVKSMSALLILHINRIPMAVNLIFYSIFSLSILALGKIGIPIYYEFAGIINVYDLLIYLPYFLFGTLIGSSKDLLNKFSSLSPIVSLCVVFVSILLKIHSQAYDSFVFKVIFNFSHFMSAWFAVAICFTFFRRFFQKPSPTAYFLSDASYTIYLFHHVLIVGLGLALIQFDIDPWMIFLILTVIVSSATCLIHSRIISRNRLLRFAFNGK